jgi:hypothetical protein
MIGKDILVGFTYIDTNNEVTEKLQLHGKIVSTSESTLTFQRSDDGHEFPIPFDGDLEETDPEFIYTLKSTGEDVTGVNYTSSFNMHQGEENDL